MRESVLLAIFLVTFSPVSTLAQSPDWAVGPWEWEVTEFFDGSTETPSSVGYTVQLSFLSEGVFREFRDGQLIREAEWEFGTFVAHIGDFYYLECYVRIGDDEYMFFKNGESSIRFSDGPFYDTQAWVATYNARSAVSTEPSTWGGVRSLYR